MEKLFLFEDERRRRDWKRSTSVMNKAKFFPYMKFQFLKSVRIRNYSSLHSPEFGLNTERYGVSPLIQSECENMRTGITPNTDTFYAVIVSFPTH